MLVLTRKQGERLHIGDDIIISVLEVKGQRVRIGIEAPRSTHVVRGELCAFEPSTPEQRGPRHDRRREAAFAG
ncbi:MAG: carbon storage regulator [Pirellulales bacterium]